MEVLPSIEPPSNIDSQSMHLHPHTIKQLPPLPPLNQVSHHKIWMLPK